jgi:hypothetical protein
MNEGFSPPKKNIVKLELWMKGLATHKKKHCETWAMNEGFSHPKKALWNLSREWRV